MRACSPCSNARPARSLSDLESNSRRTNEPVFTTPERFDSPVGARAARLRSRRATENFRTDQAQHERESLSALAARAADRQGGGGWTPAIVSEPDRGTLAREAREAASLPAGESDRRQRFGRIARARHARLRDSDEFSARKNFEGTEPGRHEAASAIAFRNDHSISLAELFALP